MELNGQDNESSQGDFGESIQSWNYRRATAARQLSSGNRSEPRTCHYNDYCKFLDLTENRNYKEYMYRNEMTYDLT